ncbi:hypothetical protein O3M35_006186 [Rhynocoris fuscipes]|uniref:PHD-type domain-containing protein n=2 Tax=Rhynocoris fuscipes TaxID=488301 RepID=A0AAW1DIC0_9HEMI
MSETPGRGYLPPTVPAPGAHRRQWPSTMMPAYFGGQWPSKPLYDAYMMLGSSSPQSEGIDLTSSRTEHNGEPGVNGQVKDVPAVSVIAPNPLVQPDIESKEERRQHQLEFVPTESKMPISYQMEYKGLPAHPHAAVKLEVGIPAPLESKGVPAESKGTPSHPVESKVPTVVKTEPPEQQVAVPVAQSPPPQPQSAVPPPPPPPSETVSNDSPPTPVPAVVPPAPSSPKDEKQPVQQQQQQQQQQLPTPPPADHVESLLENMFQGEGETPVKASVIVTNASRTPVLTDDKVVAILEDKSPVEEKAVPPKEEPLVEEEEQQQQPPQKESHFMEVESELEKMFAGIVEPEDESKLSSDTPSNMDTSSGNNVSKKAKKRVQSKPRQRKSTDFMEKKKFNKRSRDVAECRVKRQKQARDKISKDASNDSSVVGRTRGPYIHFEGSRETPKYVSVVNSNSARDEEERERGTDKLSHRRKHHSIVEGRVKGIGLYNSTLAGKYNSHNADVTWVCTFCKLRAHCESGLGGEPAGDLFGPYFLTIPKEEYDTRCPSDKEVANEQKKVGNGKQLSLRAAGVAEQFIANFTKKIRKSLQSETNEFSGETEVWVHEKCAVWASGVLLVGSHLIGLADAIASASVTKCSRCGEFGASIGCVVRNCPSRAHYGCAISSHWRLDSETFIATCPNHIKSHQISKSTEKRC